jgi:catechol 2,3-dioxygenase-like lactoylglutathione lyase family enzyme
MDGIKVRDIAFSIVQVPDLELLEKFLFDFGMSQAALENDTLYMHGAGSQQYIHVAQKGERAFIGHAFYADSIKDLEKLSKLESFSDIEELSSPGGGNKVSGLDPDGIEVQVVYGIEEREVDIDLLTPNPSNLGGKGKENFKRINKTKRVGKPRSSVIKKLGHAGINVTDPKVSLTWYNQHLGFIPTDIVEVPNTDIYAAIFARCDLGDELTDHHTFLIQSNLGSEGKSGLNHISFEVVDIDDVFLGHEVLKEKGYRHEWGIGRHFLGSQIFDYWRSPYGHIYEHMTDSDVFDNKKEVEKTSIEIAAGMQWGPDITNTFGNKEGV